MSAMPPRCMRERELRAFPVDETTVHLPAGAAVGLNGGKLIPGVAANLMGFLAEATTPADQPEFSQGGAVAGAGGAFVVDVHPGAALVQVIDADASFVVEYWGTGAAATGPAEPAEALIGTKIALTSSDLTGKVAVAADAALTGNNPVSLGAIAWVKSIVKRPQGAATPGMPSGYSQLEVQIVTAPIIP